MLYKTNKYLIILSTLVFFSSLTFADPKQDEALMSGPANPNIQNAGESEAAYQAMVRNTDIKIASMEKALEEGMKTKKTELSDKSKEIDLLNKMLISLKDKKTKQDYQKKLETAMAEQKNLQSSYDKYVATEQQKIALSKEVNESVKTKHGIR
jgi:hypothetical protein